jgi:hypothetical protein
VSDRVNCDGVGFDREQHALVADTQSHSGYTFECLHIAGAGFRRQFEINLRARDGGKFAPLTRGSGSQCDLFHIFKIA